MLVARLWITEGHSCGGNNFLPVSVPNKTLTNNKTSRSTTYEMGTIILDEKKHRITF